MKKLKIGVIGCGGISKFTHLPYLAKMENVEVIAVCDIILERAKEQAEKYGIPNYSADYKDVLKLEGIDAIDICTPNYLHSIIAVEAFEAGLHVMCEKPDAVSVDEAIKMKEASEKAGKILMVMRNNRYLPTAEFLKEYIKSGKMGDIYAGRCGWQRRRGIPGKGGWFTTKAQSGGGPLIDLGVHMLDVAIWLMGNPTPVSVSGSTFCKFANKNTSADSVHSIHGDVVADGIFDVEDLAMGFIKFDNGACLQFEVSWASNVDVEKRYVELRGSESGAIMEMGGVDRFMIMSEIDGHVVDIIPKKVSNENAHIHGKNLEHFVDVVLNGAEPKFVPQQGLDMIKILGACYESARSGKEVVL